MTKALVSLAALLALAPAVVAACGGEPPPIKSPDDVPSAAPTAKTTSAPKNRLPQMPPDSPTASAVRISDEIVKACGISEPDAYFAFDSAALRGEDSKVLDQVATCFNTGPLK